MFFCAISGEPPQDPVVSSKSGHVYERRLILKYLKDNGTDPITGEKIEEADLISVKASPSTVPPRPPNLTSIPSLLHTLQNEWDALMLETFALKQQYNSTRQQLSHALYTQDAATRVVARLIKERDTAREALENVKASMGVAPSDPSGGDVEMAEDAEKTAPLPDDVVESINETHQALQATRKKRKAAPGHATAAQVKTFKAKHEIPSLHSTSPSGINSLALSSATPGVFLTGGNDKIVQLYDRNSDKVLASLKGHTKKVNHVAFRERSDETTLLISAGADKTARIWAHDSASGEYAPRQTIKVHKGEVSGIFVHPTSKYLGLSSFDRTYSVHDIVKFSPIFQSTPSEDPFSSMSLHPDGALLGLGTSTSKIHVYDIRNGGVAAVLTPESGTPFTVNTLSFSENGYHLIAPGSSSSIAIWDLRKQSTVQTIELGDAFKINKLAYDISALYFGVAGNEGGRIFAHKTWNEVIRFEESGEMSDIAFGPEGKEIWGVTGREVRIWGTPDKE